MLQSNGSEAAEMYRGAILGPALVLLLLGSRTSCGSPQGSTLLDRSWGSWESDEQQHTIVRKTVFVTPVVKNCSDGYEWNAEQAKCLRIFKYDKAEQYRFMLERLKALYFPTEAKNVQKELGPVHMNVPLIFSTSLENETAEKSKVQETE